MITSLALSLVLGGSVPGSFQLQRSPGAGAGGQPSATLFSWDATSLGTINEPGSTTLCDFGSYTGSSDLACTGTALTFTQLGGYPIVTPSDPFNPRHSGGEPSTSHSFRSTDLGTTADAFDTTGDFAGCIAMVNVEIANLNYVVSNGQFGGTANAGGFGLVDDNNYFDFRTWDQSSHEDKITATGNVATGLNLICFGRSGTTEYLKTNLGTIVTGAALQGACTNGGNACPVQLTSMSGHLNDFHQIWFNNGGTPSDALFTRMANTFWGLYPTTGSGVVAVTRSTMADWEANGQVWQAPPSVARITTAGALVEPARTNNVQFSEAFNNGVWAVSNVTVTGDSTTGPDGQPFADTLTSTVNGGYVENTAFTATASPYATSVYLKTASGTQSADVVLWDSTAGSAYCTTTVTVTSTWTRFACETSSNATAFDSLKMRVYPGSSGTGTVYAFGAQAEAGRYASTYIRTTSTSATRNGDVISYSNPLQNSDANWCWETKFTPYGSHSWTATTTQTLLSLGTSGANTATLSADTSGNIVFTVNDAGNAAKTLTVADTFNAGEQHRISACNAAGTLTVYFDGASQSGTSSGAGSGQIGTQPTTLYVGSANGTNPAIGYLASTKLANSSNIGALQ